MSISINYNNNKAKSCDRCGEEEDYTNGLVVINGAALCAHCLQRAVDNLESRERLLLEEEEERQAKEAAAKVVIDSGITWKGPLDPLQVHLENLSQYTTARKLNAAYSKATGYTPKKENKKANKPARKSRAA